MSRYDDGPKDRLWENVYYEMIDAHDAEKLSWDTVLEIVFDAIRAAMYEILRKED